MSVVLEPDYLIAIKAFYRREVEPHIGEPVGSSEMRVSELEQQVGLTLPVAYKQYLLWMGDDFKGIFVGSSWHLDDVRENTRAIRPLLKRHKVPFKLPKRYLAFMGHQGYMYAWFRLPARDDKKHDNPTVYFFSESAPGNQVREYASFTDFLAAELRYMAHFIQNIHKHQ